MRNKLKTFNNKVIVTVKYLLKRLIQFPLLIGWIIIGTIIDIISRGYVGFIITIINLNLLALFTVIIKIITDNSTVKPIQKLKHPRLELLSGIIFYIFIFINAATFWGQSKIPYISSAITNLILNLNENIFKLGAIGIPQWILSILSNASFSIALQLIPTIILFLFWGYGFRKMGFVFNNLSLIFVLLCVTIILGLPFKTLLQHPFYQIIPTLFIMMFVNGLPEELFFRGYLLPRLEAVLKKPINALIIVAILFNMSHIPSYLSNGMNVYQALMMSFSIGYPSGLIWGYLYLKTRSIIPGIIWHTSNTILGIIFIGMY